MKKLSLLAIAIMMVFSVNAQKFGAKVGANFAGMMSSQEIPGSKMAPGMNVGVLTELGLDMIGLRIEANFSQKGFNIFNEVEAGNMITDSKVNYEYIEIPILAKVKLGPLYAVAGPYFAIAIKGNIETEYTVAGVAVPLGDLADMDLFGDNTMYKKTDFGIAAGLGAQFGLGPLNAFAEARATIGLANMYDSESDAYKAFEASGLYTDDEHLENMIFSISVGILLGK